MAYTLKFSHPSFENDQEFDLYGIGLVKNGGSIKLDKEAEQSFVDKTGKSIKDYFKGSGHVEVTGTTELSKGGGES